MKDPIIRYADLIDGRRVFDEFVARDVDVHFEAMGDSQFWMSLTVPDGRMWFINCGAVNHRAKGYANCELAYDPDRHGPLVDGRRERYARALCTAEHSAAWDDLTADERATWLAKADRFIEAMTGGAA